MHCFKRRHSKKLCWERKSQFYICVYIQCRGRRLTDRLHLKFPFCRRKRRSRSSLFPVNRRRRRRELCRGSEVPCCTTCNNHSTLGLPVRSAGLFWFWFFFSRVRVLAVKLQGNFKTFPSLSQAERLCSSSAKTLCALMIPLTTATDCYYGFCYASTFTSFKLFKIAFSIII